MIMPSRARVWIASGMMSPWLHNTAVVFEWASMRIRWMAMVALCPSTSDGSTMTVAEQRDEAMGLIVPDSVELPIQIVA